MPSLKTSQVCVLVMNVHQGANNGTLPLFAQGRFGLSEGSVSEGSYRLVPCDADSVIVASSPKASAYFLPAKSILFRVWLPSAFVLDSIASLRSG